MLAMALNLKNDRLDELEKRFKMLQKKRLAFGMFDTSQHNDDSNFTNVNLFRYVSEGDVKNNMVPRPVLNLTLFTYNPIKSSPMKKELKKYFKDIGKNKNENDVEKVIEKVGEYYSMSVKNIMGDPSKIPRNTDWTEKWKIKQGYPANSPFIQTSKLKSLVTWKSTSVTF
jgi:hypothetical protein